MKVEIEEIADRACWEKHRRLEDQPRDFDFWYALTIALKAASPFALMYWLWVRG